MSDTTKTETTKAPEKKGAVAKLQAFVQYLINEPMFWRLIIFGYISTYIINHLYKKMDFLVFERSYTRNVLPIDYQTFPGHKDVERVLNKYGYDSYWEMFVMQLIGIANILFYALFYCDLLTLTLPSALQSLDLFPFLLGLFDFVENVMIMIIIMVAPAESVLWGLVGYATVVKTMLSYFVYGTMAFSLSTYPIRYFFTRKTATTPTEKKTQ